MGVQADAYDGQSSRDHAKIWPTATFANGLAEVAWELRLLSDGATSTLAERERLLLATALVELENIADQTRATACSSRDNLVGPGRLEVLRPLLSRVIADSSELVVTLKLLRCRDLVDAATGGDLA